LIEDCGELQLVNSAVLSVFKKLLKHLIHLAFVEMLKSAWRDLSNLTVLLMNLT